jgi:hypothetical protein
MVEDQSKNDEYPGKDILIRWCFNALTLVTGAFQKASVMDTRVVSKIGLFLTRRHKI